jgi:NitT/TauT family transport system substrate-binding protein
MMRAIVGLACALTVLGACAPSAPAPAGQQAPVAGAAPASGAQQAAISAPAAARAPLERLTIGFSVVSAIHAGLYAAYEVGCFERAGLDADLVNLGAGIPAQAALASGELAVASVSGASTVNAILAGADLTFVGTLFDTMPYQLAALPEYPTVADLRGQTIGINRLGGTPHWVLRYILRQAGLDEAEVRMLQIGQPPERMAAMRSGVIQATLVEPPFSTIAEREGLRIVADVAEPSVPYPHSALVMSREWLKNNRDVARRVLQCVVEGNRAFRADRDLGLRTLRRWLHTDEQALLDETYGYFSRVVPTEPLPRAEGIQLIIEEAAAEQPTARNLRPEDLIDPSLARELR